MDDKTQTMPEIEHMLTANTSLKQWLNYYKNVWMKNLVARLVDVQADKDLKAVDPLYMVRHVEHDAYGRPIEVEMHVKERLEHRKNLVADGLKIVRAIDALIAVKDEEFEKEVLSADALAVAADMVEEFKQQEKVMADQVAADAARAAGDVQPKTTDAEVVPAKEPAAAEQAAATPPTGGEQAPTAGENATTPAL